MYTRKFGNLPQVIVQMVTMGRCPEKKHDMFMGLLDNNTMVSSPWLEWNIWDMIWLYFLTIIGELMDSCNGYFFYRH